MRHRLWIEERAKAEIRRLPGHVRQRIREAVQALGSEPRPEGSRALRTRPGMEVEARRLRVDRWRIVYVVDEEYSEVGVLAVRKRPPYDYRDLPELLSELD